MSPESQEHRDHQAMKESVFLQELRNREKRKKKQLRRLRRRRELERKLRNNGL